MTIDESKNIIKSLLYYDLMLEELLMKPHRTIGLFYSYRSKKEAFDILDYCISVFENLHISYTTSSDRTNVYLRTSASCKLLIAPINEHSPRGIQVNTVITLNEDQTPPQTLNFFNQCIAPISRVLQTKIKRYHLND